MGGNVSQSEKKSQGPGEKSKKKKKRSQIPNLRTTTTDGEQETNKTQKTELTGRPKKKRVVTSSPVPKDLRSPQRLKRGIISKKGERTKMKKCLNQVKPDETTLSYWGNGRCWTVNKKKKSRKKRRSEKNLKKKR